jgi:lipoprotein LprG
MQTRLVAFLAALLAAVTLVAGCSKSSEDSGKSLPDAATLLQQSGQTTKAQSSVHLKLAVQGEITGLPIESLEGDLTNTPAVAAQGKSTILYFGQRFEDVDFVIIDGTLYGALTPGQFSDFGPAVDVYDVSTVLNPDTGLANMLANFSDPKTDARETIGGVGAVRVTGNVSADAVNNLAPQIAATGPVPGTAWIREDGDHELVQAKLEPSAGNYITMTVSDWGKPVTVTTPAL